MHLFYEPYLKNKNFLNPQESFHCCKVLRLGKEDKILITDGRGSLYKALLEDVNSSKCKFKTLQKNFIEKPKNNLHIVIGLPKSIKRTKWFIEKATEIGVFTITPVIFKRSERKKINCERLKKIAINAMKQSHQTYLPEINPIMNFADLITLKNEELKFIAYKDENNPHFYSTLHEEKNATILIGPEGDFANAETKLAIDNGFKPVSLGNNTLRIETAGIVACQIFNLKNQLQKI